MNIFDKKDSFERKVALVIGGSGDIGVGISSVLAKNDYLVICVGRNSAKGKEFNEKIANSQFLKFDISREQDVVELFNLIKKQQIIINLVVNCAGSLCLKPLKSVASKNFLEMISSNLLTTFLLIKHASIYYEEKDISGLIIQIGSRWGESGAANACAYSAAKGGIRSLIKSIQQEYKKTKIRHMLISPGSIRSKMSNTVEKGKAEQFINPEEIGKAVLFASSLGPKTILEELFVKSYSYDI